ncbi:MAG: hypothetical protein AAFV07_01955 [Bacteroidota bacterium]
MSGFPLTQQTIDDLVHDFLQLLLAQSNWTHEAHLIVATWYNWYYDFDHALAEIREDIKLYNEIVGTYNTDTRGYHETLTVCWMTRTKRHLLQQASPDLVSACNSFLSHPDANSDGLLQYYSSKRLFSVAAWRQWLDGDVMPVPLLTAAEKPAYEKLLAAT